MNEPVEPADAQTVPAPAGGAEPEATAAGAPSRRRVVPLVCGAVALLAVAGGAALGLGALADADRGSPTVVWAEPSGSPATAPKAGAAPLAGLGGKLLPLPPGYQLGPDIGEFGNDSVLGAQQAAALLKEGARGLPAGEREKNDKAVDGLKVQGVALRSYTDGAFVTEMRLSRMENTEAIKKLNAFQGELSHALKALRAGPRIDGHANAVCFLLPKDDKLKLDAMFCNAYEGDVMVSTYTYAPAPLDTSRAAGLLRKQLDLIKSPGESV
ncbi:hypothetical protein ACFYZ9_27105 [Streptomyces sp. NPDC001691]|uniref:hypothetical protein n=1 Tax=Streptomyces sp. NPDC001691 TaxID=3364600 RepID=UPI0036D1C4A2